MGDRFLGVSKGASFVEVAVTLPIMLLCMLFLIDLTWYFVTYSVLSYAVHEGADIAAKIPVETDTSTVACGSASEDSYKLDLCYRYLVEVSALVNEVDKTADLISSRGKDSGRVYRLRYNHYYDTAQTFRGRKSGTQIEQPSALSGYTGFIRPGERIKTELGDVHDHPSRPFYSVDPKAAQGWPGTSESWASVLASNPVEITISAVYRPLTLLLPDVPITVSAFAYRKTGLGGRGQRTYSEHIPNPQSTLDTVQGGPGSASWQPTQSPDPPEVFCSCCGNPSASGCATFDMSVCYACPCAQGCGAG